MNEEYRGAHMRAHMLRRNDYESYDQYIVISGLFVEMGDFNDECTVTLHGLSELTGSSVSFIRKAIKKAHDLKIIETVSQNYPEYTLKSLLTPISKKVAVTKKPTVQKSGYVYVIGCDYDEYSDYKIGKAIRPESRLKALQVGNSHLLYLVMTIAVPDMTTQESELWSMFEDQHVNGEWYGLTSDQLKLIKNWARERNYKVKEYKG